MDSSLILLLNLFPLIVLAVIGVWIVLILILSPFLIAREDRECPRMIMGYNHKDGGCDHSQNAVIEAKWNMKQRKTRLTRKG